jgi:16S rRNA (guanine966-N2)-methyltransferase
MRIIAGTNKGKKLTTLVGNAITRPTADRVKESLFNILQNDIQDAVVIDLFSGSGALGLEALSRGALKVYFVEENKEAMSCLKQNLVDLNSDKNTFKTFQQKVETFLSKPTTDLLGQVSLIFADPPYHSNWYEQALTALDLSGYCKKGCLVVLEMNEETKISCPQDEHKWKLIDERKYSKTRLEIWQYNMP